MKRFFIGLLELGIAASGPALVWHGISLFEKHFAAGKESPTGLYTVIANNHGAYSYITESQDSEYRFFLKAGAVLLLVMFAMIFLKLKRNGKLRGGG